MHFNEQRTRQRIMDRFILDSSQDETGRFPLEVRLTRPQWEKTAAGGVVKNGTHLLPPQRFALMPLKRRQTDESDFTLPSSGKDEVTKVQFILIGSVDTDAQRGDYFDWNGADFLAPGRYRVDYVGTRQMDRRLVGINFDAGLGGS